MTWAEKEVPSLELCRRLKELGFPQESNGGWYWRRKISSKVEYELVFIKRFPKICPLFDFPLDPDEFKGECCVGGECKKGSSIEDWIKCEENPLIKAPTCREILERLPDVIVKKEHKYFLRIEKDTILELFKKGIHHYIVAYGISFYQWDKTLPNAGAKMLIWLAKNGYVDFKPTYKGWKPFRNGY